MGAKNAKKEESESLREQNVKRLCKKEWQGVDQVHLEVRGVPQLDDAGDSIWVQVWTAGELTPKPKEKKGCTKAISPVRVRSQPVDQGLWPAAGSRQR